MLLINKRLTTPGDWTISRRRVLRQITVNVSEEHAVSVFVQTVVISNDLPLFTRNDSHLYLVIF